MSSQYGGWTGKTLTVNLSTASIGTPVDVINSPTAAIYTIDTIANFKDYLGGNGLGYKELWDNVPPGTKALDPANEIIFAVFAAQKSKTLGVIKPLDCSLFHCVLLLRY
jgi:aldehyde:ferredoxin oxidoreductase